MTNPITIDSPDVVWITGYLYCKTPEALEIALGQLRDIGYDLQDQRVDGYAVRERGISPEELEQSDTYLWYASLKDIRRGKCGSCNSYISTAGIQAHGHQCEKCGAVTYRKIIEGSTVRFEFRGEEHVMFGPELNMEAKRWDADEGWLYLKYDFRQGGLCVVTGERAEEYLAHHADKWEIVEEDGERLLKLHYANDFYVRKDDVISMVEIWGHEWNHKIVKLWEGVEYSEYDHNFPLPESVHVYEAWRWAPLPASPHLHERIISAGGQVSRADYYYQDGRQAWYPRNYEEMGKFIRHFTTLNADEWDRLSPSFPLDGPGGIAAVAAFCHPDAIVRNEPNIGNFLTAITGMDTSPRNVAMATQILVDDPFTQDFVVGLAEPKGYVESLPHKVPRRLKKALRKPLSRRTSREREQVASFLAAHR